MKIALIPDGQNKPGTPIDHWTWVGKYIAGKKPDVVVLIGDFWDMPSLSSYDKGKRSFEGARYLKDIEAGNEAMATLMAPIKGEMERLKHNKKKRWKPRFVFTMGNHEYRIERAVENDAVLEGVIGYKDFDLDDWEVYDFLEVVNIENILFSHYFTSGVMGRPVSSARALLTKKHMSCVMGHAQNRDIACTFRGDGRRLTGLFCGICYQHDERYLGHQGNDSWRGMWMLHEAKDGSFDEMPVSLDYLEERYGN